MAKLVVVTLLTYASGAGLVVGCSKDESSARLEQRAGAPGFLPGGARDALWPDTDADTAAADSTADTGAPADTSVVPPDGDGDGQGEGDGDAHDADSSQIGDGQECQDNAQCQSGHCLISRQGKRCAPRCEAAPCPNGLECVGIAAAPGNRVCVDPAATSCLPCTAHSGCNLGAAAGLAGLDGENRCVGIGDGRFCAIACGAGLPGCGEGFECKDELCIPTDGTCRCSAYAVAIGGETTCQCTGVRSCEAAGDVPTACDAAPPGPES